MSAPASSDLASLARRSRPAGTAPWLAAGIALTFAVGTVLAEKTDLGSVFASAALSVYVVIAGIVVSRIADFHTAPRFGLPNGLTLLRAVATAFVFGYAAETAFGFKPSDGLAWGFALLAAGAILVDGLDGMIARRVGPATPFGARFDMEIDALLLAALSIAAFATGKAGLAVLAIGLMRYAFVAAAAPFPWLAGSLPPSLRRKTICVVQGAALVALATPLTDAAIGAPIALAAAVLLGWSFAVDIVHLAAHRARAGR